MRTYNDMAPLLAGAIIGSNVINIATLSIPLEQALPLAFAAIYSAWLLHDGFKSAGRK